MILQPLCKNPKSKRGYVFSKLRPQKEISREEFLTWYADWPRAIEVNGQMVTCFSWGLHCWYMVVSDD